MSISRKKRAKTDSSCVSKAHMNLTAADLERTHDIAYEIIGNAYLHDIGSVHISS